jgi:hypothetical protein
MLNCSRQDLGTMQLCRALYERYIMRLKMMSSTNRCSNYRFKIFLNLSYALALISLANIPSIASAQKDSSMPEVQFKIEDVADEAQIQWVVDQFQDQLRRLGDGTIGSCNKVIRYSESTDSGKDYSYGAVCNVSSGKKRALSVMMCNDSLVGKFTVGGSESHTRDGLKRFIQKNCPPGG